MLYGLTQQDRDKIAATIKKVGTMPPRTFHRPRRPGSHTTTHPAYYKQAGSGANIICRLFIDEEGANEITVDCAVAGQTAAPGLTAGDLIWVKYHDGKWWLVSAGGGGSTIRIAFCKDDGFGGIEYSGNTVQCYLDEDIESGGSGGGEEITVYCNILGNVPGIDLSGCLPYLVGGDKLFITQIGGAWWSINLFQPLSPCEPQAIEGSGSD